MRDIAPVSAKGGPARLAVLILAALVAAWFSLRHALVGVVERDYPQIGLSLVPASPVSAAVVALNRVSRDGVADGTTRAFLERAARQAPLLAEPLIAAGLDASARDRGEEARRLFEQARLRDPRAVIARYWLFDYYISTGRYAQGIDEAQPLVRLQPATMAGTAAVLTALLDIPAARETLLAKLRQNPPWRAEFVRQVAASPRLRAEAAELLRTDGGAAGGRSLREQERIITAMLARGDTDEAWSIWLGALSSEDRRRARRGRIYDPDFQGWPGAKPFNWRLAAARVSADAGRGGLLIDTGPSPDSVLAEQSVIVAPGGYRLAFTLAAREGSVSAGQLEAQIRCAGRGKPLAERRFDTPTSGAARLTLDAAIPATCPVVRIRFAARPGEEPGGLAATLGEVDLSPR